MLYSVIGVPFIYIAMLLSFCVGSHYQHQIHQSYVEQLQTDVATINPNKNSL